MSLRLKLSFMLSAFLLLIALFALGTIMIFQHMSVNMETVQSVGEEHKAIGEFEARLSSFLGMVNNWVLTGNSTYRKEYQAKLTAVNEAMKIMSRNIGETGEMAAIASELHDVAAYAKALIDKRQLAGDPEVAVLFDKVEAGGRSLLERAGRLHERSVNEMIMIAARGEEIKTKMIQYLFLLIFFSAVMAVFLIIRIRRIISEPFNELLKATEKIGKGELSYRIGMNRRDEFGIVSDRFDSMAADLESSDRKINRKLEETELFLDIARIAGTTLDLRDALVMIARTIAAKLHHDSCAILMFRPELKAFCVDASTENAECPQEMILSPGEGIAKEVFSRLEPVVIEDTASSGGEGRERDGEYRSVAAVPIIRDNICVGILLVRNKTPRAFSEDEANALKILAHTVGSVARNAELYQSTKSQLQKLTVLYEMSRAVTSVLNMKELLKKIAEEISRLLSSRICIIRLLDGDRLKIESYYGLSYDEIAPEVPLGEGIAGWVAENGSPLMVEDVSVMPARMRMHGADVKSGICVPLKVGEQVIGTLGLYDKYGGDGKLLSFTSEDLNTAEGFASISSIAIEKAKIYENEVKREREASEAKKRLDILFDSVQGGIITLGRDFTIISANKYVEDWLGISGEDLIGRNSLEIFHEKIGICPHCAAKATFETGEINSIMQSRGVNYAELTAYPVKTAAGEIEECVVFILDITERVLYQEETLSLYREVIQTKEYLESVIDNSADSIVTTDLEGIITSWNAAAEKTFGFAEAEAIGEFLPFVPDFLVEKERGFIEKIKKGEVIKDIETLRKRKDGTIIEVSLTLSPIKDAAGEVIGISGISRDISEKKHVEKELIRRNQELSRLFFISSAMRGTLELDKLLRMVLIAVTMSDGMGFNRAILFLVDEAKNALKGAMGVGPGSPEEAWKIWDELSFQKKTLDDIMQEVISTPSKKDFLDRLTTTLEIPLGEDTVLARAVREKSPFNIANVRDEALADTILIQQLGTQAYAVVPLVSRDKVIGIIWVDNYFNRKQITDEDMKFLASFSNHVASAIENARLFEKVKMTEQQLENIFESMSDMVYFNSSDYTIKSVNKAVCNKLGRPPEEIIGKKCYEVFHGMNEPYLKCPHHKTVQTKQAYIEELEDPYLGGTYLTSSSPIFDLTGEFIGSVHVVRDITELKNLQEKLVLAEKMAALGEVAAKVAHEIRNPLVSVGGFAKRLEKKLDGNLKEYAGIIVKEVERLEGILKEILGFVKEVRLMKETTSLNVLLDDVLSVMKSDVEDRGATLVRDFGSPVDVYVDPNRVKEAIMNIVSNALQSLMGTGSISIRTYMSGKYAVVEVRDTGGGIPESDRPFIFNPFFTTKASGTGLGLAITNRIIQEHGGRIEVESVVDQGSVFRVFIPIKEA